MRLLLILLLCTISHAQVNSVQKGYFYSKVGDSIMQNRTTERKAKDDGFNYAYKNRITQYVTYFPDSIVTTIEYPDLPTPTITDTIVIRDTIIKEIIINEPINSYMGPLIKPIAHGLLREYFEDFSGDVTSLVTPSDYVGLEPIIDTLVNFQGVDWKPPHVSKNFDDNYAQRIRGYIIAPETGTYVFWINSDDESFMYLSSDSSVNNKNLTVYSDLWSRYETWDLYASQKSSQFNLIKGSRYYVEVVHRDGAGRDHLLVGWSKPGEPQTEPSEVIPNEYLEVYINPE